jgi:hypothetical protein
MTDPLDIFSDINIRTGEGFVPSLATDIDTDHATDTPPVAILTGGPSCEMCGVEIPWSGRGRKPKFCQDHKTRTSKSAGEGNTSTRTVAADKRMEARLAAIQGDLEEGIGQLAGTIAPVAPVTAGTLILQGPEGMAALVKIASAYPRMLDGLEAAAKAVPFMAVGKFVAALMLAAMVDMDRVVPTGMAAEYLGVADAAQQVGWKPSGKTPVVEDGVVTTGGFGVPRPPVFKMAGAAA